MIQPSGDDPRRPESDHLPFFRLARGLIDDGLELVRQEIHLARLEVTERLQEVARNAGLSAAGVVITVVGALVFVEFLVIGLGVLLSGRYWLSALLVALVLIGTGAVMAWVGIRRIGERTDDTPVPGHREE
jgi:hypothetical protein